MTVQDTKCPVCQETDCRDWQCVPAIWNNTHPKVKQLVPVRECPECGCKLHYSYLLADPRD